jgi:hypothetical protein
MTVDYGFISPFQKLIKIIFCRWEDILSEFMATRRDLSDQIEGTKKHSSALCAAQTLVSALLVN